MAMQASCRLIQLQDRIAYATIALGKGYKFPDLTQQSIAIRTSSIAVFST
jgi:hypothetical protein